MAFLGKTQKKLLTYGKNINWGNVKKVIYAVTGDNENAKVFRKIFE